MRRLPSALSRLLDRPDAARRVGPFQLVRQLGRGGFAPVWLAREVYGGAELRLAAMKLFALGPAASDTTRPLEATYRERVIEEARALCRVEHPNVVRFYSIATDEPTGVMGVAMEYLTGTSLEARLAQEGKRSLGDTLALGAAIASALSAVHRVGLVHRDVKPANVIDSGGAYKLIDFGIASPEVARPRGKKPILVDDLPLEVSEDARVRIPDAATIERAGPSSGVPSGGGSVGYVDPACLASDAPATAASDLYALGVVLFECVAGRHPAVFAANPGEGLNEDVLRGRKPPPRLADVAEGVPPGLASLVDSLLSADRTKRPRSSEWVAIELERIAGERLGAARALPPEGVGPFRGLARFEGSDRDVYFGRSSEIASALDLLRSRGTVALVGPTGSGKSSLARAGVLPRIESGALGRWPSMWDACVLVPGVDPKGAIVAGLGALDPPMAAAAVDPGELASALAERAQASGRGVVIVVDQLEELVTVSRPDSARWCADLLVRLGDVPLPGVRALVTARRDLLDPLLALGGLGKVLVRGSLLVEPMTEPTWIGVVEDALAAYSYAFEDEALRAELLRQLKGTASAMPLVQFALTELWNKRDTRTRRVTHAGLATIGGIAGSLERHAEATVARLVEADPTAAEAVRRTLLALTTAQGTRTTRAAADLESSRATLEALERARLVVRTEDGSTLAHEALLTQWGRLARWVAEAREDRLLAEEIERDASRWSSSPELVPLWRKRRLAMAADLTQRGAAQLSTTAASFVRASRGAEQKARRFAMGASTAAVLTLAVVAFGYVRAVRASERAAVDKAAVEEQKAALELQKRRDLEDAQAEIDKRQTQIEVLLKKVAAAEDPADVQDVKRQLQEARDGAKDARARIAAAMSPRKTKPQPEHEPVEPPTPGAPPTLKIQRE